METPKHPWDSDNPEELVPTVDPADIKAAWQLYHAAELRMPGHQVAIATGVFENACSPGADISSVTYRTVNLFLLFRLASHAVNEPDARKILEWQHGDKLDDRLAEVMAKIPLKWMSKDVIYNSPPFDVDDFITQVEEAA